MSSKETPPFDLLLWAPNILNMLVKNKVGHGRPTDTVNLWPDFELLSDEEILGRDNKRIERERQPKPNDWLIYKRDDLLVQLATCWIEANDTRTPLEFCVDIWIPVASSYLRSDSKNSLIADLFDSGVCEIAERNSESELVIGGLLGCLYSMHSLEFGDIQTTVDCLMKASICLGQLRNEADQRQSNQANTAAHISAASSAFSRKGTDALHTSRREFKAKLLEYYAENGHTYKSKEEAADKLVEKFGQVTDRTVGGWLVGLKPRHPKPDKVPR